MSAATAPTGPPRVPALGGLILPPFLGPYKPFFHTCSFSIKAQQHDPTGHPPQGAQVKDPLGKLLPKGSFDFVRGSDTPTPVIGRLRGSQPPNNGVFYQVAMNRAVHPGVPFSMAAIHRFWVVFQTIAQFGSPVERPPTNNQASFAGLSVV